MRGNFVMVPRNMFYGRQNIDAIELRSSGAEYIFSTLYILGPRIMTFAMRRITRSLTMITHILTARRPRKQISATKVLLGPLSRLPVTERNYLRLIRRSDDNFCRSIYGGSDRVGFFFQGVGSSGWVLRGFMQILLYEVNR